MSESMDLQNLFFGTMSGAAIVLMGAFYALFFALCKMHQSRLFGTAAIVSYLLLAAAVFVLVDALQLAGFWMIVALVMLVGYFLAPPVIWFLCVGTHAGDDSGPQPRTTP